MILCICSLLCSRRYVWKTTDWGDCHILPLLSQQNRRMANISLLCGGGIQTRKTYCVQILDNSTPRHRKEGMTFLGSDVGKRGDDNVEFFICSMFPKCCSKAGSSRESSLKQLTPVQNWPSLALQSCWEATKHANGDMDFFSVLLPASFSLPWLSLSTVSTIAPCAYCVEQHVSEVQQVCYRSITL